MLIPYIRQSRKKEETISLDEQRDAIRRWAKTNGVQLGPEVVEQGVSGSKAWRSRELGRAVEACERGVADGLIVAYQSRLSRESGLGTAEVWEALQAARARLVCVMENIDTARGGEEEFIFAINAAIARREWKRYKEIWAAAQRRAIERGEHMSAFVPAGYRREVAKVVDGKPVYEGPLVPDPQVAPVIRRLFELRAQRASWSECAALLLKAGVQNHSGSAHWSHKAIARLVKNRVYLGEAFHGDVVNADAHEAIVEPALWRAAQSVGAAARTRQAPDDAYLAGILKCAGCGRPLKYDKGRGRYRCRRGVNAGPPCESPATVNADEAEQLVEYAFVVTTPFYLLPEDERPDTRAERQELTAARASYAAWLEADISDLDPAAFREGVTSRKARVEAAEDALRLAEEASGREREQLMIIQAWDTYSKPEKKRWLKQFDVSLAVARGKGVKQPLIERATMTRERAPVDLSAVAGLAGA